MSSSSVSWKEFAIQAPQLAAFGAARLDGRVAYLATVRSDGGPRVHPVTPILGEELYLFMEPNSPKGADLRRDGQFSLHCSVEDDSGGKGEFYIRGRARLSTDAAEREKAVQASSYQPADRYVLFVLRVNFAFMKRYTEEGEPSQRWQATA